MLKHYLPRARELMNGIRAEVLGKTPDFRKAQKLIGEYYHVMANALPFTAVNNSIFMNQTNYMLRLTGHRGIAQGEWDHLFMRLTSDQADVAWDKILKGEIKSAKELIGVPIDEAPVKPTD